MTSLAITLLSCCVLLAAWTRHGRGISAAIVALGLVVLAYSALLGDALWPGLLTSGAGLALRRVWRANPEGQLYAWLRGRLQEPRAGRVELDA